MTWPLPREYPITTPYGKRGTYWSCNEDSSGHGVHTGVDFACPVGTPLYATIAGDVRHRNYGSAFGSKQFAISPDPGEPFADGEVFYAHCSGRVADGTRVEIGDYVGMAGAEGNVSGPHLHYEFHPDTKGAWNCSVHADPSPTLEDETMGIQSIYDYLDKPEGSLKIGRSYVDLDLSKWSSPIDGKEDTLAYLNVTPTFYDGKDAGALRVRLMRENGDAHAPDTIGIHRDFLDDDGVFTTQYFTFELAEEDQWTKVQIKCIGGLASAVIGTRYTSKHVITAE